MDSCSPTPTRCPTCEQRVRPVYCAASTGETPLLLAWTLRRAARRLGVTYTALNKRVERWRGGYRIKPGRRT